MGNYISTEPDSTTNTYVSSMIEQLYTSCFASCCIPTVETEPQVKNKYQNYTDEITARPNDQREINLTLLYLNCTSENTPVYGYENLKKLVKILNVIDGDTIDLALYNDDTGKIFKHRVRLYGIDTPEMHPSLSNPERLKEIGEAKLAKEALTQRLQENDNLAIAHFHKFDKYGRLMATLFDKQGDDINKWMITSGHAQEYFGKTKKKVVERPPLMVSECDHDYFDTPRTSETSNEKQIEQAVKDVAEEDFEEFPEEITEEAKNDIHIV